MELSFADKFKLMAKLASVLVDLRIATTNILIHIPAASAGLSNHQDPAYDISAFLEPPDPEIPTKRLLVASELKNIALALKSLQTVLDHGWIISRMEILLCRGQAKGLNSIDQLEDLHKMAKAAVPAIMELRLERSQMNPESTRKRASSLNKLIRFTNVFLVKLIALDQSLRELKQANSKEVAKSTLDVNQLVTDFATRLNMNSESAGPPPPTFLTRIPPELRMQIYRLVIGDRVVSKPACGHLTTFRRPVELNLSLLRVSKLVRQEAQEALYDYNRLRISLGDVVKPCSLSMQSRLTLQRPLGLLSVGSTIQFFTNVTLAALIADWAPDREPSIVVGDMPVGAVLRRFPNVKTLALEVLGEMTDFDWLGDYYDSKLFDNDVAVTTAETLATYLKYAPKTLRKVVLSVRYTTIYRYDKGNMYPNPAVRVCNVAGRVAQQLHAHKLNFKQTPIRFTDPRPANIKYDKRHDLLKYVRPVARPGHLFDPVLESDEDWANFNFGAMVEEHDPDMYGVLVESVPAGG